MATTFTQLTSSTNQTLPSGYYYVAPNTVVNCTNLMIDSNNVTIYVPAGSTLNCKGDNANGPICGKAGIRLTGGSLHLYGGGTIIAQGGNAASGEKGGDPTAVINPSSSQDAIGTAGYGGAGGGGAGAGIGTDGSNGGARTAVVKKQTGVSSDVSTNGYSANQGAAASVYSAKLYVASGTTLSAKGGAAGASYGAGGATGVRATYMVVRTYNGAIAYPGGGGCPGKAGANVGQGGIGGPSGGSGGVFIYRSSRSQTSPEAKEGETATAAGSGAGGCSTTWSHTAAVGGAGLPYLSGGGTAYDPLPLGFLWLDTLTATQQVLTPPELVPNYVVTKLVGSGGLTATVIGLPLIAGFSPEVVWPSAPSGFLGFNEAPDGSGIYDFNSSMGIENGGLFTDGAITSTSLADITIYAICSASGPIVYINAGGAFIKGAPYVNVGGMWKQGKDVYTKVGGTWKKV